MMTLCIFPCRLQSLFRCRSFQSSSRHLKDMSNAVIVNVAQGALRGRRATSKSGGSYFSVQGIPYARPPVGHLRFKAPEPPVSWTGVRDAQKEGNVCCQVDLMLKEFVGDEDCLFLNVYTPQLPDSGSVKDASNAVMVFFHGGGFAAGSGNSDFYGPDHFVDQGVVVVTCNYRLGPLGFLSTEDGEIPGNAGLKDQVAALRWVQQNIARFGGDPTNVTIFGESAGGASVHYHLLSPMSKGLFRRAISQSGSALNSWAFSRAGRSRTVRLAQALGCKSEGSRDVLDFLRDIPAKQLVENLMLGVSDEEKHRGITIPFVLISEVGITSREEKFLLGHPADIIKSGKFNRVPYITGTNTDEGLMLLKDIIKNPEALQMIGKDFQVILPKDMYPEIDTEKSRAAAEKLKHFYFGDKPLDEETILQYAEMNTDAIFLYKIHETVRLHAAHSISPLYYYQFAFDGKLGFFKRLLGMEHLPGVCHADELGYLFHLPMIQLDLDAESPEMRVLSMMVNMWTNFAKTGNPSAGLRWDPVNATELCYLKIDETPEMMQDLEQERIQFWDELYSESKSG